MSSPELSSEKKGQFPTDALVILAATVSIFLLGGIFHLLSGGGTAQVKNETTEMTAQSPTAAELETSETEAMAIEESAAMTEAAPTAQTPESAAEAPSAMSADAPETSEVATIADEATIAALQQQLYDQIDQNWQTVPTFDMDLVYEVNLSEDGAIVAYKPVNETAESFIGETPLPNLLDGAAEAATVSPVAKFVVVMTPNGQLQVSPWIDSN
ncbi:hypothetical protein [Oxynema aestuarii]|uniref:Uncharacterized protein n=1 Tax=Oxynema aestuarii AP17 TaxID=2064643 RepID=A0A6H1U174_9CYAN|nr:hypothetical protein [Oxynema aestuarii]QIZ72137.1 hypothetical protein HCG48_17480 [Oxynema aestuarii AP17]